MLLRLALCGLLLSCCEVFVAVRGPGRITDPLWSTFMCACALHVLLRNGFSYHSVVWVTLSVGCFVAVVQLSGQVLVPLLSLPHQMLSRCLSLCGCFFATTTSIFTNAILSILRWFLGLIFCHRGRSGLSSSIFFATKKTWVSPLADVLSPLLVEDGVIFLGWMLYHYGFGFCVAKHYVNVFLFSQA